MEKMFYDTFIQSLIFDNNKSLERYDDIIFNQEFLYHLQRYVYFISENDLLEANQTNNLLGIIHYLRLNIEYENIEEKRQYYKIFNEMIEKINLMKHENTMEYYIHQINLRFFCFQNLIINAVNNKLNTNFKVKRKISYEKKEIVKETLKRDFMVFCYILDLEEEKEEVEEFLKNNINYTFLSLNYILRSIPEAMSIDIVKEKIDRLYDKDKIYKK